MLKSRLLTCVLGFAAVAMGGHLYVSAADVGPSGGSEAKPAQASVAPAETAADAASLGILQTDARSYTAIVDRPLFSAQRRPPQARPQAAIREPAPQPVKVSAPAPKKEIKTGQFVLIGVVIENGEKRALLRQGRAGELLRVVENDVIDGWRAERIEPQAVHFVQEDVVDIISLRDNQAPSTPRRAAAPTREAKAKAAPEPSKSQPAKAKRPRHSLDRLKPKFIERNGRQASLGQRVQARLVPVMVRVAGARR